VRDPLCKLGARRCLGHVELISVRLAGCPDLVRRRFRGVATNIGDDYPRSRWNGQPVSLPRLPLQRREHRSGGNAILVLSLASYATSPMATVPSSSTEGPR
jgi:hypothetical protein